MRKAMTYGALAAVATWALLGYSGDTEAQTRQKYCNDEVQSGCEVMEVDLDELRDDDKDPAQRGEITYCRDGKLLVAPVEVTLNAKNDGTIVWIKNGRTHNGWVTIKDEPTNTRLCSELP